jgi:hypothetical protein
MDTEYQNKSAVAEEFFLSKCHGPYCETICTQYNAAPIKCPSAKTFRAQNILPPNIPAPDIPSSKCLSLSNVPRRQHAERTVLYHGGESTQSTVNHYTTKKTGGDAIEGLLTLG